MGKEQPGAKALPAVATEAEEKKEGRSWVFKLLIALGVLVAIALLFLIAAILIALFADLDGAAYWVGILRDVFIIILAMEGMVMGVALIVLVLQVAALLNLVQQELPPIVDNAHETVSTVRGTAQFMSENLVEPVIKLGAATTGVGALLKELLSLRRTVRQAEKAKQERAAQATTSATSAKPPADKPTQAAAD